MCLHLHSALLWHPEWQTARRKHLNRSVIRLSDSRTIVVVVDGPPRCTVQIVILAAFQGPEEGEESQSTKAKRNGNEVDENVHASFTPCGIGAGPAGMTNGLSAPARRLSLSALATTMIDDVDMATAAIRGVAYPASAIGTAKML